VIERPINRRDEEIYTPIGLFNRGRGIFHKKPMKGAELGDSTFYWIEEGDLVLSGQFAWEGAIALAGQEDSGCIASHRYPVLRGKPNEVESAYLLSFLKTGTGQLLLDHHSRGGAGRNRPLNARTLMKEKLPIPPLAAQRRIAAIIDLEARSYRKVTEAVNILREYRTRLFADVATGKLDVREAASRLPPEAADAEPLDEIDDLPQDESAAEDAELEAADAL
jgi:type I restriction enzyme S subunit